jgi:hypothetical protein
MPPPPPQEEAVQADLVPQLVLLLSESEPCPKVCSLEDPISNAFH